MLRRWADAVSVADGFPPSLPPQGVKHFYSLLEEGEAAVEAEAEQEGPRAPHEALAKKVERLVHLMSSMTFHQAVGEPLLPLPLP